MSLRVTVRRPHELSAEERRVWTSLQEGHATFESPYFRPEFTDCTAAVRDDVHVAVLEKDGTAVGFFPFQRTGRSARPVAGRMSDYHGVVVAPETEWTVRDLLRGCGASSFAFDHLPAAQRQFADDHVQVAHSPVIDVSEGFEAWIRTRRASGSQEIPKLERKLRKCERESGPMRFEWHDATPETFDRLLAWKSEQYARTGLTDVFSFPWTSALLQAVLSRSGKEFRGVLSTVHVGDRLAAVHLGMQSHGVLHSWFPAYDREFDRYSPGLLLLYLLAREGAEHGVRRIDLGKGEEQYKLSLASDFVAVAEGTSARNSLVRTVRVGWQAAKARAKRSAWGRWARIPFALLRPLRERLSFQ